MGIQTMSDEQVYGATLDNHQQRSFSNDHSNFETLDGIEQIQIIENKGTVLLTRNKTVHHLLDLVEVNLTFQLADPANSVYFQKLKSKKITPLKLHRFKVTAIFELIKRFVIDGRRKSKEKICITLSLLFDPTKEPLTLESQVCELSLKMLNQVLKEYCKCIEVDDVVTLTAKIYFIDWQRNLNHHNEVATMTSNVQEISSFPPVANYIWPPDLSVPPPSLPPTVYQQHQLNFYAPMAPEVHPAAHLFNYLHNYPMQQPYQQCNQPFYGIHNGHPLTSNFGYYHPLNINNF